MPAPVLLFTYKRYNCLTSTINALRSNYLAAETLLIVYSDGPKNHKDIDAVQKVRSEISKITGFKQLIIKESKVNKGLAKSVIEGVTESLALYNKVIVIEDDLLTSPNFLNFMNSSLDYYEYNPKVFSISGFSFNLKIHEAYKSDVYFTKRSSSWGWATWNDRWQEIDWSMSEFDKVNWTLTRILDFNKMGSDMFSMMKSQKDGKIDSWAIRFCFHQYLKNILSVFPVVSKVQNIGFNEEATHTSGYNNFKTELDMSGKVNFLYTEPNLEKVIIRQFAPKRGYKERIKGKIYGFLNFK